MVAREQQVLYNLQQLPVLHLCLHRLRMHKQLPYIIHGIQATIARSGSPHNALHSLVVIPWL